jgi:spoIIIJ-associated protein
MMKKGGKNIRRDSVLASGKTVEKALEKALEQLKSSIDEVEIEIIDAGQKGMLSLFGSRDAQIRVSRKAGSKGVEEAVDDVARTIMECLDVNYRLFTKDEDDSTYINIETAGVDGLLIGRKGDTLNSLQHLVGRIVSKRMGGYQRLTLDVGGYLSNRREILKQKALKAAERAKKTGRDIPLEPMKAAERRIVHLTLADVEGITSYTVGNGELRKVYISTGRGEQGGNRRNNR